MYETNSSNTEKDNNSEYFDDKGRKINIEYHKKQYEHPYSSTVHFCNHLERFIDLSEGVIADIGTGLGANIKYMSERYKNLKFIGIEIDPKITELGNIYLKKYNLTNCEIINGDIYNLNPKLIDRFDGIISFQLLPFLPDCITPLENMISLRPNWIAFSSLIYDGPINAITKLQDFSKPINNKQYTEYDYNTYSLNLISEILKKNNFSKIECIPFEIDVDLKKPADNKIGTYTIKTNDGKRLQISGPLMMNWHFLLAKRI